jgi:5-methylcytosine-specific restriction protein A
MAREVEEWVGTTDSTPVPPRVRARVFYRDGGICQCGCGLKIRTGDLWDTDHTVALIVGGQNRETNLRTLLRGHHRLKTRQDVAEKSRMAKAFKKRMGLKARKITRWRRFNGEIVNADRER